MALRQRQPWDERLPDGRTVQEALAVLMQQQEKGVPLGGGKISGPQPTPVAELPAANMAPPPYSIAPPGGGAPVAPNPYRGPIEERTEGLSSLGQKLAEYRTHSTANRFETGITDTGTGYRINPPKTRAETNAPRNRLMQALSGGLQGAAMAARDARPGTEAWSALGGFGVGAATGGISPRFMEAYSRDMEKRRLQGEVSSEQALALKGAQIGETLAQGEQRRIEPYLRAEEIRVRGEREASIDRDRTTRTQTALTSEQRRSEEFKRSQGERERHNKVMEGKTTATEEIEVAGRKFAVTPAQAARILESRTQAGDKPDPTTEAAIEADLEKEAADRYDAAQTDAQKRLTEMHARRSSLTSAGYITPQREQFIKEIDGQITEAEKEVSYNRKQKDDALDRAVKARAKAQSARGGSRTIDGAIAEFTRTQKRKPTAQEIARMKAALGQ